MEDSKILSAYRVLASHIQDFIGQDTEANKKIVAAVYTHLAHIKSACLDASASFNASEQIQDLQNAQKELDLLLGEFLVLKDAGTITESQHAVLKRCIHDCDEVIRTMSDPEYS